MIECGYGVNMENHIFSNVSVRKSWVFKVLFLQRNIYMYFIILLTQSSKIANSSLVIKIRLPVASDGEHLLESDTSVMKMFYIFI